MGAQVRHESRLESLLLQQYDTRRSTKGLMWREKAASRAGATNQQQEDRKSHRATKFPDRSKKKTEIRRVICNSAVTPAHGVCGYLAEHKSITAGSKRVRIRSKESLVGGCLDFFCAGASDFNSRNNDGGGDDTTTTRDALLRRFIEGNDPTATKALSEEDCDTGAR